jgi:hypothetical protein
MRTPGQINKLPSKTSKVRAYRQNVYHSYAMLRALNDKQVKINYTYGRWTQLVKGHRYVIHFSKRKLAALLLPPLPAHYSGWICIHNREGAWDAQTGNGYYGGLQMTYGWMGVVGNAAKLSPLQQMWAAERVAARYGFSYSFMSGQWPNTFPPCAGYF